MAFRPISLSSCVTYVSHMDPAVDRVATVASVIEESPELQRITDHEERLLAAWGIFMRKLVAAVSNNPAASRDMLKFKNGESPTEFTLGVIPPDEMVRIGDETRSSAGESKIEERNWRAFLSGLRGISGWPEKPKTRRVGDVEYVDAAWTRGQFVRGLRIVALDAGLVAWHWNQLTDAEAKN